MASKIQQLRKLVEKGISNETGHRVKKMTVHNELTYIENRRLENYFIVAHKLMKQLKTSEDILIGPGRGRMISSHVCYTLGITNICPQCVFAEHVLLWGDATKNPIIDIEVDNDSYNLVYKQAIEMFGFENVARMPIKISPSFIPNNHEWIGVKSNGEKVYLHACALLICLDGVSNHFAVDEVLDEVGNRILCAKEFIEECDNQSILRYNVLKSNLLTRIKQIQRQIEKNGKQYSKIYEKRLWEEDYELFNPYMFNVSEFLAEMDDFNRKIKEFNKTLFIVSLLNDPFVMEHDLYLDEETYEPKTTKLIIASKQDVLNALVIFDGANNLLPTETALLKGLNKNYRDYNLRLEDDVPVSEYEKLLRKYGEDEELFYISDDGSITEWDKLFIEEDDGVHYYFFTVSSIRRAYASQLWYRNVKDNLSNKLHS